MTCERVPTGEGKTNIHGRLKIPSAWLGKVLALDGPWVRGLSVLSGTTWKGAKLWIGEAPSWTMHGAWRMSERARRKVRTSRGRRGDATPRRARRPRRGHIRRHPPKNHTLHAPWHKTSLLHLIRPMKRRPAHPLPAPTPASRQSLHARSRARKKPRAPTVPTHARVRVIDPRMYGAVHLREDMLVAIVASQRAQGPAHARAASPVRGRRRHGLPRERRAASRLGRGEGARAGAPNDNGGAESAANDVPDGPDDTYTSAATAVPPAHAAAAPAPPPKSKPLKDLFQPREEEARFSLMAHLGDLDLDLDRAFALDAPAPGAPSPCSQPRRACKPDQEAPHSTRASRCSCPQPANPRAPDIFSSAHTEGWAFGRTGDADSIRARWDATKGALTRAWKKRALEAVKARERRYGTAEGEDA
ncbi:hypothetical protein JB92DRAFT_2825613 [Gautieria morchelliformis]|nr:hypothetical protein JB92DRAFT_2825613 [Gautieria morchelliformis]